MPEKIKYRDLQAPLQDMSEESLFASLRNYFEDPTLDYEQRDERSRQQAQQLAIAHSRKLATKAKL